ncbi:YxlC family protein [Paenibacillus sp. QZ-Y1]|uniref:YxlC family protein n=1 Tax=Paenibacillus sp. QZ-Y1 TaxID=3414511 RepID=UPI003F790310
MNRSDEQDEQEIVARIQQQMNVLDDAYEPVSIPSLASLESQVREQRRMKRRANRLEMILFWAVGLLVLTCGVLLFQSAPALYLGIQALSVGAAITVAIIWAGRRQKETWHE